MNGKLDEKTCQREGVSAENAGFATKHGLERTMERTGKNSKQAMHMIQVAWKRGKKVDDLPLVRQRE